MSWPDPPWKRYAIRMTAHGEETWLTDDGTGCDDALDFTEWGIYPPVVYVHKDEAKAHARAVSAFYRNRGQRYRFDVRPVLEHPGGTYDDPRPLRQRMKA